MGGSGVYPSYGQMYYCKMILGITINKLIKFCTSVSKNEDALNKFLQPNSDNYFIVFVTL